MVKINPMKIPGGWRQGYVLDYHTLGSDFLGYDDLGRPQFDTKRTELGEILYRLKYKSDRSVIATIVETAVNFIETWNPGISVILPVPASKPRAYQPVLEIARNLSTRLTIPIRDDCIVKVKKTPELKNIYDYHTRLELLEDAHRVQEASLNGENVLLFDDLYRSGATLNAITDVLYSKGEATNIFALALTRTRSIG